MTIAKSAIEAFLNRDLDEFDFLKGEEPEELDQALSELDPAPEFHTKPFIHQKVCFLIGCYLPEFLYFLDMGCVDADTEYLSPTGWKRIGEYDGGKVCQYDPYTREGSFVEPSGYLVKPCPWMYHYKTDRGCDQMLSSNHKILAAVPWPKRNTKTKQVYDDVCPLPEYDSDGYPHPIHFVTTTPRRLTSAAGRNRPRARFETSFKLNTDGVNISDSEIRLQVAFIADGTIQKGKVNLVGRVNLKKEQKKKRLRILLSEANREYKERVREDGYSVFEFDPPIVTKTYPDSFYEASLEQKEVICDEVVKWDGNGVNTFYTRDRKSADFVQFCFVSTGRRAYRSPLYNGNDYIVHAVRSGRTGNLAHFGEPRMKRTVDGKMYCFNVPTGFLVFRRNGNVFVSGNTGKTKILLDVFYWHKRAHGARRLLALVPNASNLYTWYDEVEKHRPELSCLPMDGSTEQRWDMLEQDADVFVLNYPGFVYMVTKANPKRRGKKSKANVLDPIASDEFAAHFDMVAFDESQAFKNVQSLTYSACRRLAGQLSQRYALTGTPFGRQPLDLWAQFYVIDRGKTLGPNKAIFQESFFEEKQNPFQTYYKLDKSKEKLLHQVLKNRSIRFKASECIDLPDQIFKQVPVQLPKSIEEYYLTVKREMQESYNDRQTVELNFAKMRQLASGFLYYTDPETEERINIDFESNPKLDALEELVLEMPEDSKMVVFHEFVHTGELISQRLKKLKIKHQRLWSGTKDHKRVLNQFNKDPATRVFAVNNASGAQGLNLQVANYVVFYESPVDPIIRQQAEKRCHRPGQESSVFYFDIVAKDTVDERIMFFLREGKNLLKSIIDGKGKLV